MRKQKILFVTTTYPTSDTQSTGFFLTNITTNLPADNEVTILTLSHDGKYKKYIDDYGNEVIQLPYSTILKPLFKEGGLVNSLKANKLAWIQLIEMMLVFAGYLILRGNRYDVIHGHWVITGGLLATVTKFFHRRPVVVTAHGAEFYFKPVVPLRWLVKFIYSQADKVIFVSKYLQSKANDWAGFATNKAVILYNCVDTTKFFPDYSKRREQITFISLKRLSAEKRIIDIIGAAKVLVDQGYSNFAVWIIGHGPDEEMLKEAVARLGISEQVRFWGYVPNSEIPNILQQAHVYINPSIQEGFATTNVETQAAGLLALTTTGCGSEEIFIEGQNGMYFEPQNPQSLASKMAWVLQNSHEISRMSQAARTMVEQHFSAAIVGKQYGTLYSTLINKISSLGNIRKSIAAISEIAFASIFGFYLILSIIDEITKRLISSIISIDTFFIASLLSLAIFIISSGDKSRNSHEQTSRNQLLAQLLLKLFFVALVGAYTYQQMSIYGDPGILFAGLFTALTALILLFAA